MKVTSVSGAFPGGLTLNPAACSVCRLLLERPACDVPLRTSTRTPVICGVGDGPARREGVGEVEEGLPSDDEAFGVPGGPTPCVALLGKAFLMRTTARTMAAIR